MNKNSSFNLFLFISTWVYIGYCVICEMHVAPIKTIIESIGNTDSYRTYGLMMRIPSAIAFMLIPTVIFIFSLVSSLIIGAPKKYADKPRKKALAVLLTSANTFELVVGLFIWILEIGFPNFAGAYNAIFTKIIISVFLNPVFAIGLIIVLIMYCQKYCTAS